MSRILLLLVFLIWMTGVSEGVVTAPDSLWANPALFLAVYPALVLSMAVWGRYAARKVLRGHSHRPVRRFHNALMVVRLMVPIWFAVGVFGLGWTAIVEERLGMAALAPVRLPGLILGTLPAVLTWIGLWWAQYPAERAIREQHIFDQLEDGVPTHAPPSFRKYLTTNLRLQILFTLVPVLLIVALRDVASLTLLTRIAGHHAPGVDGRGTMDETVEFIVFLVSAGVVFLFAPAVLRHVLRTSPLPDGPLRRRLENLCRRTGMRCRDILVWHTQFNMGNAAVMGVLPGVRYVLLSDLLLERMDDDQIEAVFAHEIGHVVHRHMIWYVVFFLTIMLATIGPSTLLDRLGMSNQAKLCTGVAVFAGGFWLLFGFISRRFERQADVFAARVLESARAAQPTFAMTPQPATTLPAVNSAYESPSFVGRYGAQLFSSALHRVATINNIPLSPRARRDDGLLNRVGYVLGSFMDLAHDWLHGSIPSRMAYLHTLSTDPAHTGRFDRVMSRLYAVMIFALVASAAWTWMAAIGPGR